MTTPDLFMLGAYADGIGGMTALDTLLSNIDIPVDPDYSFAEFSAFVDTASGAKKGMGFPTCTMHWAHLNAAQVEALRDLCSGLSAKVMMRVYVNDTSSGSIVWHTFSANMLWPAGEVGKQAGFQELDFTIQFRTLVQVE
jgi:hypothetical protein